MKFASLCVLAHDRPSYLDLTLTSLRSNTTSSYELIIHDDGSKDHKIDSILYSERVLGATVIQGRPGWNQGQGVSLNRMFSIAKGDPIIKLDADLKYAKGWLLEVNRLFDEHPDIGLLGLMHYYYDPVDTHKTVIDRYDDYSTHTHILGSAFALRREVWEELGPFPEYSEAFAEDWEMQKRVTESDKWVCALPKESLINELDGGTMGLGKSSLFDTEGNVKPIKKTPYIQEYSNV